MLKQSSCINIIASVNIYILFLFVFLTWSRCPANYSSLIYKLLEYDALSSHSYFIIILCICVGSKYECVVI